MVMVIENRLLEKVVAHLVVFCANAFLKFIASKLRLAWRSRSSLL